MTRHAIIVCVILGELLMTSAASAQTSYTLLGGTFQSSMSPTRHAVTAQGDIAAIAVTSGAQIVPEVLDDLEAGRLNAADAALSLAFGQIVASGGSWVSLSGIMTATVYDPQTGQVRVLDAGYRVPMAEPSPGRVPPQREQSGRGVLVPGFPAGTHALHDRFGRATWQRILQPAQRLATEGVTVSDNLAELIEFRATTIENSAEMAAIFAPNGQRLVAGDLLLQPALATLLRDIEATGPGGLMTGKWAQYYAAAVKAAGGRIAAADLADNEPEWGTPDAVGLAGQTVHLQTGQLGGACLADALSQLDATNVMQARDIEATKQLMRVSHRCYVMAQTQPHTPPAVATDQTIPLAERLTGRPPPMANSDVIAVVDRDGMVVVLAHSINTTAWGELGRFVQGVALPDSASFQQRLLAPLGPGDRVPHALVTLIATQDQRPVLAAGAIGGSVSEAILQTSYAVLAKGQSLAEGTSAPQFLRAIWPSVGGFQVITLFGLTAVLVAGTLAAMALPSLLFWPLFVAFFVIFAQGIGIVLGGMVGCRGCIGAVDWPRVVRAIGLLAVALAIVAVFSTSLGLWRSGILLTCSVAASLLPLILRGSLVTLNLALPGTYSEAQQGELARNGLVLREILRDPPFGYVAGIELKSGQLRAAVSPTSLDGVADAR